MKYDTLWFFVVPHKYKAFSHHLEVGHFPSKFIFSSVLEPFLREDEEIGHSREVVDLLKSKIVNFYCFIFQVQDNGAYPLGIDGAFNAINFCIVPLF